MDGSQALVAESLEGGQVVAEPLSFEAFFESDARTLFRRLCAVPGNSAEAAGRRVFIEAEMTTQAPPLRREIPQIVGSIRF